MVLLPLLYLLCRYACCGSCCDRAVRRVDSPMRTRRWQLLCVVGVSILLLFAAVAGMVVGLQGSTKISTSVQDATGHSRDKLQSVLNDVCMPAHLCLGAVRRDVRGTS